MCAVRTCEVLIYVLSIHEYWFCIWPKNESTVSTVNIFHRSVSFCCKETSWGKLGTCLLGGHGQSSNVPHAEETTYLRYFKISLALWHRNGYSLQIMIPRWKVRSRHKMRKMPLTSRCRKHPKTIDTTCRHDMTKSIGELHGAKELLALHFGMSTGRQVDRSTGPWQVTWSWHVRLSDPQCCVRCIRSWSSASTWMEVPWRPWRDRGTKVKLVASKHREISLPIYCNLYRL